MAMTFWGKERFLDVHDSGTKDDGHGHDAHGHGPHIPHESPPSMWVPLAVLAVLAVVGGFVGISTAFTGGKHVGGRMNIVTWLEPVIWNPQTKEFNKPHEEGTPAEHAQIASNEPVIASETPTNKANEKGEVAPYGDTGFNLAHAIEEKLHSERATEFLFIAISVIVALFGMFLGWLFYIKKPGLPDAWAARLGPLYRASYNKYWVDELYGAVFTRRTMDASRARLRSRLRDH